MDQRTEKMLARLDASPDNPILRVAVVRTLMQAGETSHAVSVAFDLDQSVVQGPADRALIADLFDQSGLDDEAALWRGANAPDASGALTGPGPDHAPASVAEDDAVPGPHDETGATAQDTPDPGKDRATGQQPTEAPVQDAPATPAPDAVRLRVVGGTEGSDTAEDSGPSDFSFADVGGLGQVKRDIQRRIIAPFQSGSLLSRFRRKGGGGVLLYGPPGCGKTLIARATAGECKASFTVIQAADVLRPLQGESESMLSGAFARARANTPAVLFLDEVDALASKRSEASASHVAQLISVLLTELDGVEQKNDGVLVLAATNLPWTLDSAFLRPGRFDRLFFVPPPDRAARTAILRLELADQPQVAGLDIDGLAAKTSGMSGADLAAIIARAADAAIDQTLDTGQETPISQAMLTEAAKSVRSSVTDWLTTARNYATYANESGRYDDILAFLKEHGR